MLDTPIAEYSLMMDRWVTMETRWKGDIRFGGDYLIPCRNYEEYSDEGGGGMGVGRKLGNM